MSAITLTVTINHSNHGDAIHSLHAGGYCGLHRYADECHFSVSVEDTEEEQRYMALVADRLISYSIPFTISY